MSQKEMNMDVEHPLFLRITKTHSDQKKVSACVPCFVCVKVGYPHITISHPKDDRSLTRGRPAGRGPALCNQLSPHAWSQNKT